MAHTPFTDIGELTASFGVVTLADSEQPRAMLRRADAAMYTAKNNSRNAVVAAPPLMASTHPR